MKKSVIFLTVLMVLSLTLAGCGSSGNSGGNSGGSGVGYAEDGYAEGRMGDTMHTYFFDYTVNSAYVCDEFGGYTPADGNELLAVEVTVKNTFSETITMWDGDFQAQWSDDGDDAYAWPITDGSNDVLTDDQLPGEYDLKVNEEKTGLLVYEVPAGEQDFSISTLELFDDGTDEGEEGDTFFVFFSAEKQ